MRRPKTALLSLVCYLVPVLGPIYVLTRARDDGFARVHGQQMLTLAGSLVALFAGWAVVGWVLAWIPVVGPLLSAMLFALVIAGLIAGVILWIVGLIQALRGEVVALPLIWDVSRRVFPS